MTVSGEHQIPALWVRDFAKKLQRGHFRRSELLALDHIFSALDQVPGAGARVFVDERSPANATPASQWSLTDFPIPIRTWSTGELDQWVSEISVGLLFGQGLPKDFPVLLLQSHGLTYWIWRTFATSARPKVVVADYDPDWSPVESVSPLPETKKLNDGPSLRALERFGQRHGYSLVGAGKLQGYHRAFFVAHELLHHREQLLPLSALARIGKPLLKFLKRPDPQEIVECNYLQPHYLRHLSHLGSTSKPIILECGSRDALDACSLAARFDARVFAFECNPQALALCRENARHESRVTLVEQAVWIEDGAIEFFPIDGSQTVTENPEFSHPGGNIGASSCFQATNDNPLYPEKYTQGRITVPATRLDTFCSAHRLGTIDLLCMDLQGAELKALQSLGDRLASVRAIITEVTTITAYEGADTYEHLLAFLSANGFQLVEENLIPQWGLGDAMFIRP